jgi:hypothetical protein
VIETLVWNRDRRGRAVRGRGLRQVQQAYVFLSVNRVENRTLAEEHVEAEQRLDVRLRVRFRGHLPKG